MHIALHDTIVKMNNKTPFCIVYGTSGTKHVDDVIEELINDLEMRLVGYGHENLLFATINEYMSTRISSLILQEVTGKKAHEIEKKDLDRMSAKVILDSAMMYFNDN